MHQDFQISQEDLNKFNDEILSEVDTALDICCKRLTEREKLNYKRKGYLLRDAKTYIQGLKQGRD